jgi:hypothetical protein
MMQLCVIVASGLLDGLHAIGEEEHHATSEYAAFFDLLPVENVPKGVHVGFNIGPKVVDVSVLPHVQAEDGNDALLEYFRGGIVVGYHDL